ncbi:uncharacterized protein LOC123655200 [Melitaea cinxia]|uniref:uncharacterized protein LOC123655200 n=1 Tax=Melitaea cinxia TaxID=113334 RepID=UPI001E273715|nr:uncharacterized protein LOC123655200 [Melitaea cinxia]
MLTKTSVTGVLLTLFLFFKFGSSIFCYDCNSAFDPRCGERFDPFSLGVVNCSLKDPPEHIEPVEPTFCRIIKMEIYGNVRIVRQCGYLKEESEEHTCRKQTGNGEVFVTYCTCDTDLCNGAPKIHKNMALILAVSLIYYSQNIL